MRYVDDYSLTEIAQELDASPQAVVDFVKRAITSLERYEEHLGLVRKHEQRQVIVEDILAKMNEYDAAKGIRDSISKLASV